MAERTLVMGILNVTPDSFSDGGRYAHVDDALAHAHEMVDQGADIVDVGGESTRPGSTRIGPDEGWARIGDVVRELAGGGIVVSVDTLHAVTARRAAAAGATIINDVSGGVWDPGMSASVASTGCRFVVQHYRALPGMPGESFDYGQDVVGAILERLGRQIDAAIGAGIAPERLIVDPGLGFSVTNEQCVLIVESLPRLTALGYPVLIGASRKRFIKAMGGDADEQTARISSACARQGVWAVRVHDVARNARAVRSALTGPAYGGECL